MNVANNHTRAPWYYVPQDNHNAEVNIGETVCSLTNYDKNTGKMVISREEMEANAKLISAAPNMYDALLTVMCHLHNNAAKEHIMKKVKEAMSLAQKGNYQLS